MTCASLSPAGIRPPTRSRKSRARGASESSIDWFWHTMHRNSRDKSRARASFAVSDMISSGWTARAGEPPSTTIANRQKRILFKGSLRRLQPADRFCRFRRADTQPPIRQRQQAAERHQHRAEPDQQYQRLVVDPHRDRAVTGDLAKRDVKLTWE